MCEQKEHRMMHSSTCKKPNPKSGLKNILSRCLKGSLLRELNYGHICVCVCVCVCVRGRCQGGLRYSVTWSTCQFLFLCKSVVYSRLSAVMTLW